MQLMNVKASVAHIFQGALKDLEDKLALGKGKYFIKRRCVNSNGNLNSNEMRRLYTR
jgi:hypothetical protein